jgi:curved DNA-binding protein CbpA
MPQPNLNTDEYYTILGCDRNASDAALKKAYRKLAVKWHPDKNPDNEQATRNFQKISEAYATLSDPQKRKLYDQYGKEGADAADNMPSGGFPGGAGGFPGGMHFGGGMPGGHSMSPDDAQKFFSQMFGGDDPFGGIFGGAMGGNGAGRGGMPNVQFQTSMNGMPGGMGGMHAGMDPFAQMFAGGGMPGMNMMGGSGRGMPGMPGMPARAQQQQRYDTISPGTVVSLVGLVNASDKNGDRGVIKQYSPHNARYVVTLEDDGAEMSVKASNLLQHVHVRIHDIEKQPELNGKTGTILTWIPSKERYNIHVSALKKIVSLKPANVVLDTGTVGQIYGLKSKPELNGKFGTIQSWIRDSNKYDVQLSPSQVIRIKVENMRV